MSRVSDEQDSSIITNIINNNNNNTSGSLPSDSCTMNSPVIPALIDDSDSPIVIKQQNQHQQQQQQKNKLSAMSKSCDNSPVPAMSASRRKSFKDNMESLVRRLERELADGGDCRTTAAQRSGAIDSTVSCRTLSRANGTQTMPVGGLARGNGRDIAPFTFRRVYVVDEPPQLLQHHSQQQPQLDYHQQIRLRAPSTSSTPNSSSADNSSVSDCSSDTVSEFSIDSSSDRSSIISLEDSLDHHTSSSWCRPNTTANLLQQTHRLRKLSASCFNVWDTSGGGGRRKWPKECSGAVARAMSQFANGCSGGDCRPAARLRVFDDKTGGDPCTVARDKRCVGLELMRERNGNVVVIREIKANGGSRYARCSELKCETVQSRIRKLQVHHSNGSGGGIQMEKSSNIF